MRRRWPNEKNEDVMVSLALMLYSGLRFENLRKTTKYNAEDNWCPA
jgi:hypothetical protein